MKKRGLAITLLLVMLLFIFTSSVMANEFQIVTPSSVKLTSPNGGENFVVGTKRNITWEQTKAVGYVSITYSIDSGATFTKLGEVFEPQLNNIFEWTVPDTVTTQALIAINWRESPGVWYVDFSDATFTISKGLQLIVVGLPLAPSNLEANALSMSAIELSWSDNANNEAGYKIERKFGGAYQEIAVLGPDATGFKDSNLEPETAVTYRVRAYNNIGNSAYSNEASAKTLAGLIPLLPDPLSTPNAPTELNAAVISSAVVNLNWKDNSNNEDGFSIERKTGNGQYGEIATVGKDINLFSDSGLSAETVYTYRVKAYNANGESAYSNEFVVMTPIAPDENIPADVTITKFYINQSEYYINDQLFTMDAVPIISNSRTLLPIRYVAEALGATVAWDGSEKKVTINLEDTTIELWINQKDARVNGIKQQIDPLNSNVVPVSIPPGRTMLPLRFIVESLGSSVQWDPNTQEVLITYPKQ